MRRSKIVNNNGRSNSVRLSISARENPKWFAIDESERTRPFNNHSNNDNSNINNNLRGGHEDNNMHHHGGQQQQIPKFVRDDDDRTMATMTTVATMATKAQALNPQALNKAKDLMSPTGSVSIVFTDVQGSTALWESCPSDMKAAIDIHDAIMRQCYTNHHGYEINTEGDAFHLAFQHPADALAFALQAQLKLYKADWPDGILRHKDGKDEPALKLRGFRVRFGIHHGPTTCGVHEMTGRTVYVGEAVDIAKTVERYCHGGQILTTMETWKAVSGMAERYLGRPQVLDCGEHLLFEKTHQPSGTGTRYTRRIMQLVPSDLAFDFFESRGRRDVPSEDGKMGFEIKDSSAVNGRLFPPLQSKRQLTTCFLNAPYANGRVTICFIYTVGLHDDNPEMKSKNLGILANKYVRKNLLVSTPPGYECQEDNGCWMIAFDKMANAVNFGLQLKSALKEADDLVGTVDCDAMFKVGIVSGPFTSMGPHRITGMADYFGPIVNRTARVAMNCEPGQVCVGIPLSDGVTADPPDFGSTISVKLLEIKKLKGITIDMAIFECSKRNIETPYI
jgi:class 3 adenylate cyclase